jgi:4-hydroxybenzoate polyprenyltransferase/phosphoserine phosphatase
MIGEHTYTYSDVSAALTLDVRLSRADTPSPIIVDLDGTLTPTDTLAESLIQLSKRSPASLLRLPLWLLHGRAAFKEAVAARTKIAVDRLPYREPLLAYLRKERESGRRIVLATAAHDSIARAVATHLGLFDEVIASDNGRNLKGFAKLAACYERVGDRFVYAGDGRADIPLWNAAQAAILVAVNPRTAESVRRHVPIDKVFPREGARTVDWLRALRVHHWLKNLLLFVPLLTAFLFKDVGRILTMLIAFIAFSFAASATYVLNDLWDLENDRAHPRKRLRPFASGKIPILHGVFAAAILLLAGLLLASVVSNSFLFMLISYLGLTSAYSWFLKEHVLIDVLTLASLYVFRILAGSVAIGIETSAWLLAFSSFVFLSLALGKRCSELISLDQAGKAAVQGRDYRVSDLGVLQPLGIGAALSAVVVFGLFINDFETQVRYASPQLLWLVAIELTYWLGRTWIKISRGEMHDDPVVYAVRDRTSFLTVLAMVATVLAAHFVSLGGKP